MTMTMVKKDEAELVHKKGEKEGGEEGNPEHSLYSNETTNQKKHPKFTMLFCSK